MIRRRLRLILFPFSVLYGLGVSIRNGLYRSGMYKRAFFEIPIVAVGNLSVGGSGKSPMINYLVELLSPVHQIGIISRGYGRRTRGFRLVKSDFTAAEVGDEPLQFARRYGGLVKIAVGEERALAIPELLRIHPNIDLILLDDAFQHLAVKANKYILLTLYDQPFTNDYLLPSGDLREARTAAKRADLIVVTKCPDKLEPACQRQLVKEIRKYNADAPVFFSRILYKNLRDADNRETEHFPQEVIVLTGIAKPVYFTDYVREKARIISSYEYRDHYNYRSKDIIEVAESDPQAPIITTEKDFMRIISLDLPTEIVKRIYYLPIGLDFLGSGKEFDKQVRQW